MPYALLHMLLACPRFAVHLFRAIPAEGWRHSWKRLPLFLVLWLAFCLLNLLHIMGHLADMLLFPASRKVTVERPVFILGLPRSGTTFLQRALAADARFTTFTTWEAVFAPSITERFLYRGIGLLLSPLNGLVRTIRRRIFRRMDSIHMIRLQAPEEDFLLLFPLLDCFLGAFLCPGDQRYWELAQFDKCFPPAYKAHVVNYYRQCLQKHLYYHGREKTLLSKNPSFTGFMDELSRTFPDGRFIACIRPPEEVVPSQLSAMRPAMALLGAGRCRKEMQDRLIDVLHHYYTVLQAHGDSPRVLLQPMRALREHFLDSMRLIHDFLSLSQPAPGAAALEQLAKESRTYRSRHRYDLADFSLDGNAVRQRFADVWPPYAISGPARNNHGP